MAGYVVEALVKAAEPRGSIHSEIAPETSEALKVGFSGPHVASSKHHASGRSWGASQKLILNLTLILSQDWAS